MEDPGELPAIASLSQATRGRGVPQRSVSEDELQRACRKGLERCLKCVKDILSRVTEIQKRINGDQPWGKVKLPEFVGWFIWPNGELQGISTGMWRSGT